MHPLLADRETDKYCFVTLFVVALRSVNLVTLKAEISASDRRRGDVERLRRPDPPVDQCAPPKMSNDALKCLHTDCERGAL